MVTTAQARGQLPSSKYYSHRVGRLSAVWVCRPAAFPDLLHFLPQQQKLRRTVRGTFIFPPRAGWLHESGVLLSGL